jgi:hypothetical protein
MTAPVRELDDNESSKHAPKKPRRPEQDQNPDSAAPKVDSAPPPSMPKLSEPPWKQKDRHWASAGVVATGELRPRLSLVPDRVPEPQLPDSAVPIFGAMRRLVGVIAVVTAAIVGYRWGSAPQVTPPSQQRAPASDYTGFTPGLAVSTADFKVSNPDLKPTAAPSIASAGVNNADADAAPAATASVTSTAAARQGDAAEIAFLVKNGAELMANGDVAAARLMFQHAAEAGSAEGAFALAETYDPSVFQKLGRREAITLDITLARSWYEKARSLGSTAARERIVRLTQRPE